MNPKNFDERIKGRFAMRIICSWCRKFIRERQPTWDKCISHSICEECYEKVMKKNKSLKRKKRRR
jgi:hypothetical protein